MHRALAELLIHTDRPTQNVTLVETISHFKISVLKTCLLIPAYSNFKRKNACMEQYVCAPIPPMSCMNVCMYRYTHT